MGDVLDDVMEMLIVDAQIYREPQTFDTESTPGDKTDRGELKPGVGGQVSVGATTTTMIASTQARSRGQITEEEGIISAVVRDGGSDREIVITIGVRGY